MAVVANTLCCHIKDTGGIHRGKTLLLRLARIAILICPASLVVVGSAGSQATQSNGVVGYLTGLLTSSLLYEPGLVPKAILESADLLVLQLILAFWW